MLKNNFEKCRVMLKKGQKCIFHVKTLALALDQMQLQSRGDEKNLS